MTSSSRFRTTDRMSRHQPKDRRGMRFGTWTCGSRLLTWVLFALVFSGWSAPSRAVAGCSRDTIVHFSPWAPIAHLELLTANQDVDHSTHAGDRFPAPRPRPCSGPSCSSGAPAVPSPTPTIPSPSRVDRWGNLLVFHDSPPSLREFFQSRNESVRPISVGVSIDRPPRG
jgi:hypothetical protein